MRTALALATAVTASLVGLGTAAPADANTCGATVPGYHITTLTLHAGVSCEHAKQVVHHAMRSEAHKIGWTCRHDTFAHRYFFFSCWANNGSGHWLTFDATYA